MAQGKKTSPEDITKVMTLWSVNQNLRETSRELGVPLSTVKDIVDKNRDEPYWKQLRTLKQEEFIEKATEIIFKGFNLLERRMDRAIEEEDSLDDLIEEIDSLDNDEMSYQTKMNAISKIRQMQMYNIKDISTVLGTMFDKRALASGNVTQKIDLTTNVDIDKLIEIAGYKKGDNE